MTTTLLGATTSAAVTLPGGDTCNTAEILQRTAGTPDPTQLPGTGTYLFGISTAGIYADSTSGQISQINSYIKNTGTSPTAAVAGWAEGGGSAHTLWGGFFAAVAKVSSDLAWGVEINAGYSGASGSAFAGGLFVVGGYGQSGGTNTGYALRVAAEADSAFAIGLGFRSDVGQPVVSTGDLIFADGGVIADRGINMAGAEFSTAAAWLPVNGGAGLILEAYGAGSSSYPFIQIQSHAGMPSPTATGGILFHVPSGSPQPVATGGTLISADGGTYASAIDVSAATFNSPAFLAGGGQTNHLFTPVTAQGGYFAFGTAASPDIRNLPALKAERYLSSPVAMGAAPEQNSAIYGIASGAPGGQTQPVGVLGVSQNTWLVAPTGLTGTASAGGSFASGTYFWKVTAVNAAGETTGSNELSKAVTSGQKVALSWTAVTGAATYNVYRSTTSGGESTSPALVASSSTNAYTDTGTAVASGAVPASNTYVGDNDARSRAAAAQHRKRRAPGRDRERAEGHPREPARVFQRHARRPTDVRGQDRGDVLHQQRADHATDALERVSHLRARIMTASPNEHGSASVSAESLDPGDLAIHKRMVARFTQAQQLSAQAQQIQARANELAAGFKIWAEDLHERYRLDASRGESITEDGTIIRTVDAPTDGTPPLDHRTGDTRVDGPQGQPRRTSPSPMAR